MVDSEQQYSMLNQQLINMNEFNVLKMRLDTQPILDQLELFLRGSRFTMTAEADGGLKVKEVVMGVAKLNQVGIQSLLNWLSSTINCQVVQGNFPMDQKSMISVMYEVFIRDFQINLGNYMVLNCYEWEMKEEEIEGTIDFIMNLIVPFMSRLIGNQERKSYAKTMESKEHHVIGGKGIPTFKS